MPKEVLKITKDYMFSPKRIEVASRNEGAKKCRTPLLHG